jgi:hypothetical protein
MISFNPLIYIDIYRSAFVNEKLTVCLQGYFDSQIKIAL